MQLEHLHFALVFRIAHLHAKQETIELSLGQAVDALLFDWVLRGQHHERLRQRMGLIV